jgi:hypothetical protein
MQSPQQIISFSHTLTQTVNAAQESVLNLERLLNERLRNDDVSRAVAEENARIITRVNALAETMEQHQSYTVQGHHLITSEIEVCVCVYVTPPDRIGNGVVNVCK